MKGLKKGTNIEVEISPTEREEVKSIPKAVSDLIEWADYFVMLFPTEGKSTQYINQEIGYAYNLYRKDALKIIALYQNKKDFEGFITRNSEILSSGYKLKMDKNRNITNIKEIIDNIKEFIWRVDMFPIEILRDTLEVKLDESWKDNKRKDIRRYSVIFGFEVNRRDYLNDLDLQIVYPPGIKEYVIFGLDDYQYPLSQRLEIRNDIPSSYHEFFKGSVKRVPIIFNSIKGIETYNAKIQFFIPLLKDMVFGLYFQHVRFGARFYEFEIKHKKGKYHYIKMRKLPDVNFTPIRCSLALRKR